MGIRKDKSWVKRVIALGMTACIMVTTPFSILAENMPEEGTESQEITDEDFISDGSATESDAIENQEPTMEESSEAISGNSESEENSSLQDSINSADGESSPDNADGETSADQLENADSTENKEQTESTTGEDQKIQLSLELLAEETGNDAQKPSLTLENACNLQANALSVSNNVINVTDGTGLILLSNVTPLEYQFKRINLITNTGWDVTKTFSDSDSGSTYSFLGLGSDEYPYAGNFSLDSSTSAEQYSIITSKALFNALSTKATFSGTIPFTVSESAYSMEEPLLTKSLKNSGESENNPLTCTVAFRNPTSNPEATIGGLIGTMEKGTSANITFTNYFQNTLTVSGKSHTGLFCNTMEKGTSLTATLEKEEGSGAISVTAASSSADAGGFVGHMDSGILKISGNSVETVTSKNGNAGGLVGSANGGKIELKQEEGMATSFKFADLLELSAGEEYAAGGLIGAYTFSEDFGEDTTVNQNKQYEYNLSGYQFHKITISGGKNAGGLFGVLTNNIAKNAISISVSEAIGTIEGAISKKEVTNFGGAVGSYSAENMGSSFSIKGEAKSFISITSTGGANAGTSYGGVIGEVSKNSYVEIENVSVSTADMNGSANTSFGGLVGKINDGLLNVGNVTLTTTGDTDLAADNVDGRGGLVGHLVKGVLRLHGTTDLSKQKITAAYNHTGQIVGNNENGLVYATGNGSGLSESGGGWELIRYSGRDRSGSDIGNWGAVVRLGEKLTEDTNGVLSFNETAHTVKVNSGNETAISNENAFAAYVLAFDLSKAYVSTKSAALSFDATVDPSIKQTVTLTEDIDLTGTGILGIGKDNIEKGTSAQKFTGTLNGNKHTITLDIGTTYGEIVSDTDNNAAGQLYAKRSEERDAHYSLALIPFGGAVTIQDLTIAGTVNSKIPGNSVNEVDNSDDIRYPAFVSAAVGLAYEDTVFENVTVNTKVSVAEETGAKKLHVWQAGFLGRCESKSLTFRNCTWRSDSTLSDNRSTDNQRIGGLAAEVMGGCTVTVENCTLSGSITSKAEKNACVGGLIAVSRGETQIGNGNSYMSAESTIGISNLTVNGEVITADAISTSGGLLGYQWKNTKVDFAAVASNTASTSGVTISGSTLTANAQFGGLVYQATGYWKATAANSIVFKTENKATNFTGKSMKDAPSGLLVGTGLIKVTQSGNEVVESALYLEAGTWGTASDAAYKINSGAVTLDIGDSEYFDELVGTTKKDDAGNSNAVVSLAVCDENGTATKIDQNTITTYTEQLGTNYKNSQTRYYYNLDSYRRNNSELNLDSVSTPENLVLWSVAQYAAPNIRGCFRIGEITAVIITGTLNLTGYSYYPVTPLGAVNLGGTANTSITFAYDTMNTTENGNKRLSDSEHQHYLMQHGLFYNVSRNIDVKNTTFSGTVGKEGTAENGNAGNTYNSGALIYGGVTGDPVNYIVEISLNNVTLKGIRVTGVQKNKDTYAPLLINRLNQAVKLTVNNLSTGVGYTSDSGSNGTTYAATSLVGEVGSRKATKLTLSFSNIALDGRLENMTGNTTSVFNNGKVAVYYNTTHTIFTKATLLESFMYSSEGSGTYNFNTTDNKVTYGVELTNTGTRGRNPDKQYQYYDSDSYITDEQNQTATAEYVKSRYSSSNFIRYVYTQQNIDESKYELDINQKTTGLLKGCGTYGDPYIIEDAHQLSSLAAYIQNPGSVSKFQAIFNSKVLENQTQTAEGYHLLNGATSEATGTDIIYTWENGAWKIENGNAADEEKATNYLLNAYYKIDKDITLSAENFSGLGTKEKPFSGVIVGASENTSVALTGTNSNKDSFGGLIAYSRGSVVKNLIVDYLQATITMQAASLPGSDKNPFFGGVVGYCMGGDTIIDHVSVSYGSNSVSFSGEYEYMIAAGGYVGLVGGATHITENNDYEKTGGGVVFRNMEDTSNTFTTACADAATVNKTVNMVTASGTVDGKKTSDGGKYFYRNPYVGRVLDGYACAEGCTVNNTDKNYTIPTLTAGTSDLQVTDASESLNVTVTSAQGLWLLSAIVNSGAGAMAASGSYTDVDGQVVDAYQSGKPRTASYEEIGTASTDDKNLADEAYWGGVVSTAGSDTAKSRVSYLVKNYTTGKAAARLAGKSSTAVNNPVSLAFTANSIDMSSYGNGFRGIGASYGENKAVWNGNCSIPKVYRRNLLIQSINTDRTEDTMITLNMNQNDYHPEYSNGSWLNQGAGLFVDFHFTNDCKVNHLKISGNVKLGLFDTNGTLMCVTKRADLDVHIGVGGFAARTANSSGKVTFDQFNLKNINVYGGTMTGGAIGYIDGYNNSKRNVTFNNWSIENVNVSKWVQNDGSSGGLVGWNVGYGALEIKRDSNEDVNIKNLKVTTISDGYATAAAGGIVGACDFSGVNIENVNANNVTITGENVRDIGGLIAGKRNGTNININVTNCVLHSIEVSNPKKTTGYTGGIIGYHDSPLAISGVTMDCNSKINGQQYTGGFVGQSNANVNIMNCSERDTYVKSDTQNWVGGFIGHLYKTATFQNCQQENVTVLGRYVGGLIGAADGNIQASNVAFANVVVATKQSGARNAGLVTGSTYINKKNISVKGYNFLAQSCKVGLVDAKGANDLLKADIKAMDNAGFWIGISGPSDNINLTAVSVSGTVLPQKDIGTQNGSATIIYADATAIQTYQPTDSTAKPSSSASPWLDVNPKSDVPFADGTVMTGNGVGMQESSTTASAILNGLQAETPASDVYWNLLDNKAEFVKFLDTTNDAYVTTYRKEESSTTTVKEKVDFPVLVVNNTADVDTMIWNYIAAMTNVSSGTDAKQQSNSITATTYQWDTTKNSFEAKHKEDTSLSISNAKKISIVPNAYDNQNSQFTLLDVTYANPTSEKKELFHLYIPVLVKKVLYIWFKTRFIAGTDYCADDYAQPMNDGKANHYATADFDEPLTAYIEYTYDKDTDWQAMLDNGENLLWHYDKILDLASGSTAENGKTLLPKGTRLTLVDRQTKQYYTYTTETEDEHNFNLANMKTPMKTPDGTTAFAPVDICDLLGLTVSGPVKEEEGKTYYVKTNKNDATVKVGNEYYRKAQESDTNAEKFSITIGTSSQTKAWSEGYFLTIQIPKTDGVSIVNNRLNYAQISRKSGTLPASIKTETNSSGDSVSSSGYIVYKGVDQTLTVSTSRIHNGTVMDDTVMENGDGIKIKLVSKLMLTEQGKDKFSKLGPETVYHQFDISLKKYLTDNSGVYNVIGTEKIKYTYTVKSSNETLIYENKGELSNAASQETVTVGYGNSNLKKELESAKTAGNAITITAEFILTYDGKDYFPVRNTTDFSDSSGTSVVAVSRIANTESQLSITKNKNTIENEKRYYITNPSKADLTYSTVDGDGTGDATQQLGINPSDSANNRSEIIYTKADYDYSGVDTSVLESASKICYKMELFQKEASGAYDEANPLAIGEYLQSIIKIGSNRSTLSQTAENDIAYQWVEDFSSIESKHQSASFSFTPLTGEKFETNKYAYANYRVRLTVVLLDKKGNELDGTKASDYIIYTNARIYQGIINELQSTASDSEQ